jgi:hypothetical protein
MVPNPVFEPYRYGAVVYASIDPLTGKKRFLKEIADGYTAAQVVQTKLEPRHIRVRPWRTTGASRVQTRSATSSGSPRTVLVEVDDVPTANGAPGRAGAR